MAEIKKINTELQPIDKLLDTSGDAGTSGQILSTTGSGTNWIDNTGGGGTVTGTGTDEQVTYWTGSSVIDGDSGFKYNKSDGGYAAVTISSASSPQLCFVETGSAYTDSMRIVRGSDKLYFTYGHNANEEAITIVGGTGSDVGFVGIGTTTPDKKVHIQGDAAVTGAFYDSSTVLIVEDTNPYLQIIGTDGGNQASTLMLTTVPAAGSGNNKHWAIQHRGTTQSGNFGISYDTTSASGQDGADGTDLFVIETGGDVGIGTVNPTQKLEVQGTILVNNEIQFTDGNMRIYRSSDNMYLRTGGTNRVTIASGGDAFFTGRVAIGNTSVDYNADADDLIVGGGSGDTGITIVSGSSAGDYGAIYFADGQADGAEEYRGIISYEQNNEIMRFHTNTVEALELGLNQEATFAGNVTAATVLNINRAAGSTNDRLTITSADIVTTIERVENTGDASAGYGRIDFKTNAATGGTAGRGGFKFIDGDGNNILYLENNDSSATFEGKILAGTGTTAAATINAFTTTVSANLYSALRIIENSAASTYWDIGATGGASPDLKFFVNAGTTPKFTLSTTGVGTFASNISVGHGQIITPSGYNLALNPNTGTVTIGGIIQCSGVGSSSFAGPVHFADGSVTTPSIANTGDTNTGIYWPGDHQLGFAVNGSRKFYMSETQGYFQNLSSGISVSAGGINVTGDSTFVGSIGTTGDMVLKSDNVAALTLWDSGGAGLGKFHNNLTIIGKATSAATITGDGNTTLTTKGYVDGLIVGATIYQGTWDANNGAGGTPDLTTSTYKTNGYYFVVSVAGDATPNDPGTTPDDWHVGDWVIYNDHTGSSAWQKIDNSSILSGVGQGQTVALWQGTNAVTDSETLGNAPITFSTNDATFAGNITVSGTGANGFSGDLDVSGTKYLYLGGHVRINNPGSGVFKLGQYDGSSWTDTLNITNAGAATFAGSLTVNGNTTLGDAGSDDTTINGQLTQLTTDALGYKLYRTGGGTSMLISAAGDAEIEFGSDNGSGTNTTHWTIGKDNTDNSFRISNSAALGTSDALIITPPHGAATFKNTLTVENAFGVDAGAGNNGGGISWGSTDSGFIFAKSGAATKVYLNSAGDSYFTGGQLGIGTASPQELLDVNTVWTGLNVDNTAAIFGNDVGTTQSRDTWIKMRASASTTDYTWAFGTNQSGEFRFNYLGTRATAPTSGTNLLKIGNTGDATFAGDVTVKGDTITLYDGSGASVGALTVLGGNNLTISGTQSSHCGFSFATNAILPATQGATNSNTVDLGASSEQYKDFYYAGAMTGGSATFAGDVTFNGFITVATYKRITVNVPSAGGTWFAVNHAGNESWTWEAQSGSGSDDYISLGISGGTRAMSWHEDGKIGIGNSSPSSALTVGTSGNTEITIGDASANAQGRLRFLTSNNQKNFQIGFNYNVGGGLEFTRSTAVGGSTFSTPDMVIQGSTGNVGIGTTSPAQNFVVAEGTNQHGIELVPGTLSYIQAYDRATSAYGGMTIDAKYLAFGLDNGAEKIRFTDEGKVGIGTTSPSEMLQVQKDQAAESGVNFINNSTAAGAAMRLEINVGAPAGNDPMVSFNIGNGGFDWTIGVDNSDSDKFKISGGTDSHNPNLGTNDRLVIDSSGNVGIGTTTFASTTNLQLKMGNMGSGAVGEIFDAVDNIDNSRLIICGGGYGSPQFSMRHYSAAYGFDIWMDVTSTWDVYFDARGATQGFRWRNNSNGGGGAADELMHLADGGDLTIAGDVYIAEATNKGQLFFGTANTDYEIKGGGNYGYLSLNAPILRFYTAGTQRMHISASTYSSYTPDGIWGATATPSWFQGTTGRKFYLGYQDNGSGLYAAAYGFETNSTDGLANTSEKPSIILKNTDSGNYVFQVSNLGAVDFDSTLTLTNGELKYGGSGTPYLTVRSKDSTTTACGIKLYNGNNAELHGYLYGEGDSTNTYFGLLDGSGSWLLQSREGVWTQLWVGGSCRMHIDTGSVGIGTTSPQKKLDVLVAGGDGIRVSNSTNSAYYSDLLINYNDLSTMQLICMGTSILQAGNTGNTVLGSRTNKDIILSPNGTGNVGIGVTSPSVKLEVDAKTLTRHTSSSWGQSAIANPSDAECAFVWAAGGTGYPGITSTYTRQWIAGLSPFSTGTDRWSLTNKTLGATTAITVLESGDVGMGTIDPYAYDTTATKFHVKNASAGSGAVGEVARFEGSTDADGSGGCIRLGTNNDRGIYFEGGRTSSVPYGKIGTTEYDGAKTVAITLNNSGDVFCSRTVGIATTSVTSGVILEVAGAGLIKASTGVGDFYLGNYATGNYFRFHTNNANTYFDMNCGDMYWRQGASTRYYFYASTANMTINGTLTQNSDSRVKENIVEIDDCIGKVQAMRGVYYNRTDFNTEVTKVGVIAQEVETVLPELILESPEDGLKSVAYSELTAVLINAVKEQQEIIEDLKTRIEQLEN